MSENKCAVLAVGGGPVGLSLAGDLGWRGVSCRLVERGDGSIYQPKMDMVGVRTMEFCRRWGIAGWVEHSPYPRDYPQDNVWVESLTGYEFGREPMVPKNQEPLPPQSPQKRERCPQDMFDPILQRFVRQFDTVSISYHTEFLDFEERADRVISRLRNLQTNEIEVVESDFLVGTDGAASTVRTQLGIEMRGKPVLTYTTNVIFRCHNLPALHNKGKAYRFIFIGPEGTWLTIVAINGADRWRMSIVGDATKRNYDEQEVRALIIRAMGKPFDFEIESTMPWIWRELVAEHYSSERVFLAGDSCHLTSPTGGFGMNTGIADAVDLAWKIDAVSKGWGGKELLQSYSIERQPVAVRAVTEATGNLQRMLSTRNAAPPAAAFQPGPEGDKARKKFGDEYTARMKREWYSIGIHMGFNYYHSPVVWPDGSPEPPDEVADYKQTGRPGHRAPHVWLSDGRSTLDLFGRGFVLLQLTRVHNTDAIRNAARQRGVPLQVVDLTGESGVREVYGADLVLVRPDGHVAWRGATLPVNPGLLLDVVRGLVAFREDMLSEGNRPKQERTSATAAGAK